MTRMPTAAELAAVDFALDRHDLELALGPVIALWTFWAAGDPLCILAGAGSSDNADTIPAFLDCAIIPFERGSGMERHLP